MAGKFIVITGLDGSGTTSIGKTLAEMDKDGYYLQTPEGLFSEFREQFTQELREIHPEAHYLYYLTSVVKASNDIKKKLKTHNVYCVRYLIDTVVSHRTMGLDVDLNYNLGFTSIVKPDLTLFIDINEDVRQQRITERGKSILDKTLDDTDFRQRFKAQFKRLASHYSIVDNSTTLDDCLSSAKWEIDKITK
ncbi:dTMP kinase [Photobacterium sanguinicancri]|uniref:dTMP kinase n=1 Tax=Photobacterium sanguinicancri TaxID=875932 RepID=UPI003D0B11D6